jgi:hypothetical protein
MDIGRKRHNKADVGAGTPPPLSSRAEPVEKVPKPQNLRCCIRLFNSKFTFVLPPYKSPFYLNHQKEGIRV